MKKTVLTLTLLTLALTIFSQAKLDIGLKAGVNLSEVTVEGKSTDGVTSLHGGVYVLAKLGNIGIQPEVLFSKQGSKVVGGEKIDLSYVNVPVMLKIYLPLGLNFQAGPQFGILTNAKDEAGKDITNTFKESDISVAAGAGWDAPFGLQLSARYILGLSDISVLDIRKTTKNNTFQIAVGYSLFKFGQ